MGIVKGQTSTRRPKSRFLYVGGGGKYVTDKHLQRFSPPERKLERTFPARPKTAILQRQRFLPSVPCRLLSQKDVIALRYDEPR